MRSIDNKALVVKKLRELGSQIEVMESGPSVRYKKRAYLNAASSISNLSGTLTSADQVKDLKGVGPSIFKKVVELLSTGGLKKLEDFHHFASDFSELLKVSGVGPVKARHLFDQYGVKTVEELKEKLVDGTIDDEKLLKNVEWALQVKGERIPHAKALKMANEIIAPLEKACPKARVLGCGSIRRKKATSKDIDIVFAGNKKDIKLGRQVFLNQQWDDVLSSGDTRVTVIRQGVQVDIRFVSKRCYGSAILYFTGSGDFNKIMRLKARAKGFKLNEYGLKRRRKDGSEGELVASKTEEEIFKALGYPFIPVEKREASVWIKVERWKMRKR